MQTRNGAGVYNSPKLGSTTHISGAFTGIPAKTPARAACLPAGYICGPDAMIQSISDILEGKGAHPDAVIFEK